MWAKGENKIKLSDTLTQLKFYDVRSCSLGKISAIALKSLKHLSWHRNTELLLHKIDINQLNVLVDLLARYAKQ